MIRHPAIVKLSQDHHQALMEAIRLKRASDETAATVAAAYVEWFDGHAQRHFEIEEQVLLPAYLNLVGLEHGVEPVIVQVLREHVELRALAEQLRAGAATTALIRETGSRLDDHVRLEERKLFPQIQQTLSDEQLDELAVQVARAEPAVATPVSESPDAA
jgi:hemerythrin-like domain-containing protein